MKYVETTHLGVGGLVCWARMGLAPGAWVVSQDSSIAYIFTDHATRRMRKRGITKKQVRETIEQPEIKYPDRIQGRWVHLRTYGQRQLKIVMVPHDHDVYVVTAYWLEVGGKP
jgi:hypothetical protein